MSNIQDLPVELQLATSAHVSYIQSLDARKDEYEYWLTEHLRLNGLYWGLTALHLLRRPDALPRDEAIAFVLSCQHENGGFGAAPGHDPHMLYTVSAVQILTLLDAFEELEKRGKGGGKAQVGKCESSPHLVQGTRRLLSLYPTARTSRVALLTPRLAHPSSQSSQICRTERRARSPATSGARKTRGSYTAR